ncbi:MULTISPECIES: rcc01693 family protein [Pacificibacter]|uniref:rcc01693 family protein n=1 Tax=Pacificibacter TaxID=1042323 RepID=UPI001C08C5F5|nr:MULTISPECIES: rcc01693 family protein [Pacificibacter]MBU2935635.1 phage tail assembly chaperone [Pacificibacter marinus]MDO6614131.1 phage tail assembly chaperone [Pacificibacter sp. 1_MG-2023]
MSLILKGGFDWPALMRAGINGLRLRPVEFWALTPAELLLMLGAGSGAAPLSRARLDELAQAYPDKAPHKTDVKGQDNG